MSSPGPKPSAELPATPGSYILVWRCTRAAAATAGALGRVELQPGTWLYVGSARGPGGLAARVRRHWRPAGHQHWHMDYLKPLLQPVEAWVAPGRDNLEHRWAEVLACHGTGVPGFGCSDCRCPSHFFHWKNVWPPEEISSASGFRVVP
ncbi:MAG: DUF123 domain-containing protein [Xanthomonadales bacterium]|nr:DUF123 domain-containing protein [Xanthomonadales bacterium]